MVDRRQASPTGQYPAPPCTHHASAPGISKIKDQLSFFTLPTSLTLLVLAGNSFWQPLETQSILSIFFQFFKKMSCDRYTLISNLVTSNSVNIAVPLSWQRLALPSSDDPSDILEHRRQRIDELWKIKDQYRERSKINLPKDQRSNWRWPTFSHCPQERAQLSPKNGVIGLVHEQRSYNNSI